MDDELFGSPEPIYFPDEEARLAATAKRVKRLRRRKAGIALAAVAIVATVLPFAVSAGAPSGHRVNVVGSPTTVPPTTASSVVVPSTTAPTVATTTGSTVVVPNTSSATSTTVPIASATTNPAPETTVPAAAATTTTQPPNTLTGTVTGPNGQPIAGAYVIGLDNLQYVTTDQSGHYTMTCAKQPLMASTWIPWLDNASQPGLAQPQPAEGYLGKSVWTTNGQPPPAGPAYTFSGKAGTANTATIPTCGSTPVDFQLPESGSIYLTSTTVSTPTTTVPMIPPDVPGDVMQTWIMPGLAGHQPSTPYFSRWTPGLWFGLLPPGTATIRASFRNLQRTRESVAARTPGRYKCTLAKPPT